MEVMNVTQENFEKEVLQSDKPVLIDFFASWCGPCKMMGPIIDEMAEKNSNIKFVKINVDEQLPLAQNYQVMHVPTFVAIKDGKMLNKLSGATSENLLLDLFKEE